MTFKDKIKTIGVQGFDHAQNRKLEADLESYRQVRSEGSQPQGTQRVFVEQAKRESDRLGRAFRADHLAETYHPEVQVKPLPSSPYFGETNG